MSQFVRKHLDPASRLGEILFGLIMVLTITLTAGLTVTEGPNGVRQLLVAAIGCNIAWGIIDAVMYVMNSMVERSGTMRLVQAVRQSSQPQSARPLIENQIAPGLLGLLAPEEVDGLSRSIHQRIGQASIMPSSISITRDDILGGIACFWLVFASCLPATIPFLFFSQAHFALRVSNFLLIALLFLVGQKWADYAGMNRLGTGAAMVAIGLVLVGVAIMLGG